MRSPMTKLTWKTQDGTEIPITNMTDSHLTNALRMLRRNSPLFAARAEMELMHYLSDDPPEMAGDAAERALEELEELQGEGNDGREDTDELCLRVYDDGSFEALVAEAKRRKLPAARDEHRPEDEARRKRNKVRAWNYTLSMLAEKLKAKVGTNADAVE